MDANMQSWLHKNTLQHTQHTHKHTHTQLGLQRPKFIRKLELGCPSAENPWTPSSLFLTFHTTRQGKNWTSHTYTHAYAHTHTHTHTHTWFYARGCINMNRGWQWRAEWSPVHPIFIIYLRLNGFGTLLDGSPLTQVCLLKCEKCYITYHNLTFFHFFSLP